jgi:hypothetical protein
MGSISATALVVAAAPAVISQGAALAVSLGGAAVALGTRVGLDALVQKAGYNDVGQLLTRLTHFLVRGFKDDKVDTVRGVTANSLGLARDMPLLNLITRQVQNENTGFSDRYDMVGPLVENLYVVLSSSRSVFSKTGLGDVLVDPPPRTLHESLQTLIMQVETVYATESYQTILAGNKDAEENLNRVMVYSHALEACLWGDTKDACDPNDHQYRTAFANQQGFQVLMSTLWQKYSGLVAKDPTLKLHRVLPTSIGTTTLQVKGPPTGSSALVRFLGDDGAVVGGPREVQLVRSDPYLMCSSNGTRWEAPKKKKDKEAQASLELDFPIGSTQQVARVKEERLEVIASQQALYVTSQDMQAIDITYMYFQMLRDFADHTGESALTYIPQDLRDTWDATLSWIGITELLMDCLSRPALLDAYQACLSNPGIMTALSMNHATPWEFIIDRYKTTTNYGTDMHNLRYASQLLDYWPVDTPPTTTEAYWTVLRELLPMFAPQGVSTFSAEQQKQLARIVPPEAQKMLLKAKTEKDLDKPLIMIMNTIIEQMPLKNMTGEGPKINAAIQKGADVSWVAYAQAWWASIKAYGKTFTTLEYWLDPLRDSVNELFYWVFYKIKTLILSFLMDFIVYRSVLNASQTAMIIAAGDSVQALAVMILTAMGFQIVPIALRLAFNVVKGSTNLAIQHGPGAYAAAQAAHNMAETRVVVAVVGMLNKVGLLPEDRAMALALLINKWTWGLLVRGRITASAADKRESEYRAALGESTRLMLEAPRTIADILSSKSSSYSADGDTATLLLLLVALS